MNQQEFFPEDANIITKSTKNAALSPAKIRELAVCSTGSARKYLSFDNAIHYQVLPLSLQQNYGESQLVLLTARELGLEEQQELEFLGSIKIKVINQQQLTDLSPAIYQAYKLDEEELELAKQEVLNHSQLDKSLVVDLSSTVASNSESKFAHTLIEYSLARQASDIHLVPTSSGLTVKIRIQGEVYQHPGVVADVSQQKIIVNHLKVLASLKSSESRLPQDGVFHFITPGYNRWLRISTMPTDLGEKVVLRLPRESYLPELKELGFDGFSYQAINKGLEKQSGLIMLAGTTGSGKTTTLYALLSELKQKNLSIVSVEDPVEIDVEGVEQTSINLEAGLNYQVALRALLRQDPDVILIGEIRDQENAEMALRAAQSGHLILAAVHANSVLGAISRLEQMGVNQQMLLSSLNLIVHQQLVKTNQSNSFLSGRELLTETLVLNNKIREQIANGQISVNNIHLRSRNYRSRRSKLKELLGAGLISRSQFEKYKCHE